jgi:hypothetical protein
MKHSSKDEKPSLRSFLIELLIYGVLVVLYFVLVLHFLGDGIKRVYDHDKRLYALLALALMVGQGVGLEMLTTWLLRLVRSKAE